VQRSRDDLDAGPVTITVTEFEADMVVVEKTTLAEGIVRLTLQDQDGRELPRWSPGSHVDLIAGGQTRQYSLCGDRRDRRSFQVAVLDAPDGRGGSRFIHEQVEVGTHIRVRGPRNHFALQPSARYLFIAGGIGITPILPMIAEAEARGANWRLLYGGRSAGSMAFATELARFGDRVTLWPQDRLGLLDLDGELGVPQAGLLVYCCGPEPLLAAVEERCARWEPAALHVERFQKRQSESVAPVAEFEVELRRSELVLRVPPDRSIIEVVEEADVDVFSSCLEGVCGSCETAVLGGVPDHRDSVLSPADREAGQYMMICVSRSCTPRLVLDL
jgi:ferredoxin-NADP reductase